MTQKNVPLTFKSAVLFELLPEVRKLFERPESESKSAFLAWLCAEGIAVIIRRRVHTKAVSPRKALAVLQRLSGTIEESVAGEPK